MKTPATLKQTIDSLGMMYRILDGMRDRRDEISPVMYALQADGVLIEIERLKAELDELVDLEETKRIIREVGAEYAERQVTPPAALAA